MASDLKNMLAPDGNWLVEMIDEEPVHLDPCLYSDNNQLNEDGEQIKQPREIGILPIRNAVAYPGTIMPLAIGRKRSKALLADIEPNETVIGLLTQRNPETDRPDFDNLYSVGTIVSVLKVTKLPQGSMHIVVHGITRFKVIEKVAIKPYLKARIKPLSTEVRKTKKLQALRTTVHQAANRSEEHT